MGRLGGRGGEGLGVVGDCLVMGMGAVFGDGVWEGREDLFMEGSIRDDGKRGSEMCFCGTLMIPVVMKDVSSLYSYCPRASSIYLFCLYQVGQVP